MQLTLRWLHRNGWRLGQILVLAWIAIELHHLVGAVNTIDTGSVASSIDGVATSIDGVGTSVDGVATSTDGVANAISFK